MPDIRRPRPPNPQEIFASRFAPLARWCPHCQKRADVACKVCDEPLCSWCAWHGKHTPHVALTLAKPVAVVIAELVPAVAAAVK